MRVPPIAIGPGYTIPLKINNFISMQCQGNLTEVIRINVMILSA